MFTSGEKDGGEMILSFKTKFPWGTPTNFERKILDGVKIHTIRPDAGARWTVGRKIHFSTGVRTKSYKQFASGVVTDIRKVEIHGGVYVDGDVLHSEFDAFWKNDGFDIEDDFWKWFKFDPETPFVGKLIFWRLDK